MKDAITTFGSGEESVGFFLYENKINTMLLVTVWDPKRTLREKLDVMSSFDINAVLQGKLPSVALRNAIIAFDEKCTASGSGIVACLQGANRTGLFAGAFIMS